MPGYGKLLTMRYAISIPQFHADGTFDPAAFRTYMRRAEELGFESAWTTEQIIGTMPDLAPIETMTYAAACTERIRLGCSMHVLPLYSPLHLAKSLSTLDQLSRGRLEVGVGVGGRFRMFTAFAVDPSSLVARFNESLDLMEKLWTDERVTFKGRFWQLEDAAMEPKPWQKPRPPLWFGGTAPAALRRAVSKADGFFGAGSQNTAQFAEQMGVIKDALRESGRTGFRTAKRAYIAIDDDEERARARMADALEKLYGYFGIQVMGGAVFGPLDKCLRELRAIKEAGAEMILLNPLYDDLEQMERLAAEVVPAAL